MSEDYGWVAELMRTQVPWVASAGVRFVEVSARRTVCSLPDEASQHNHVGGPHAAMIFGLAETASGALAMANFASTMDRAVPLVARADASYRKLALGPLTAEATLDRPAEEVLAELDGGGRPEFAVPVTVRDKAEATTATLTVVWVLRPNR